MARGLTAGLLLGPAHLYTGASATKEIRAHAFATRDRRRPKDKCGAVKSTCSDGRFKALPFTSPFMDVCQGCESGAFQTESTTKSTSRLAQIEVEACGSTASSSFFIFFSLFCPHRRRSREMVSPDEVGVRFNVPVRGAQRPAGSSPFSRRKCASWETRIM